MRIKDARQTFLGLWIRLLVEGKAFEDWGGQQLRDFTYVDDAVEALLMAVTSEDVNGQVFNLGGFCGMNLYVLADLLVGVNDRWQDVVRPFPLVRIPIDIGYLYD